MPIRSLAEEERPRQAGEWGGGGVLSLSAHPPHAQPSLAGSGKWGDVCRPGRLCGGEGAPPQHALEPVRVIRTS